MRILLKYVIPLFCTLVYYNIFKFIAKKVIKRTIRRNIVAWAIVSIYICLAIIWEKYGTISGNQSIDGIIILQLSYIFLGSFGLKYSSK